MPATWNGYRSYARSLPLHSKGQTVLCASIRVIQGRGPGEPCWGFLHIRLVQHWPKIPKSWYI